jgi:hypothetical protein
MHPHKSLSVLQSVYVIAQIGLNKGRIDKRAVDTDRQFRRSPKLKFNLTSIFQPISVRMTTSYEEIKDFAYELAERVRSMDTG